MNINLKLLFQILILEAFYFLIMYYLLIFTLFFYFGSGAGASSPIAEVTTKISQLIIIAFPLLFNYYKALKLKKIRSTDASSFLVATLLLILIIGGLFIFTDWIGT